MPLEWDSNRGPFEIVRNSEHFVYNSLDCSATEVAPKNIGYETNLQSSFHSEPFM